MFLITKETSEIECRQANAVQTWWGKLFCDPKLGKFSECICNGYFPLNFQTEM